MKRKIFQLSVVACVASLAIAATYKHLNKEYQPIQNLYKMSPNIQAGDYVHNVIMLKVKAEYARQCASNAITIPALIERLDQLNANSVGKMFPRHKAPELKYDQFGRELSDLSRIYQIHYEGGQPIAYAINLLLESGFIEYASPKFIPKPLFSVNDPALSQQYFIHTIKADSAWKFCRGDSNVVIGITDSGTDLDHPDLQANLKLNYNDPLNNIDDDNDGYVDNYAGWDLGEKDNNATVDQGGGDPNAHGSIVTGCAAAVTNNGVGVTSPGFSCRYLPVKIADNNGAYVAAYEGIVYAADHGCQIINCSWGSLDPSPLEQEIINYAVINKNCVVFAAAGNGGFDRKYYPASYQNVYSISNTDASDLRAAKSDYNYAVDISAPGSGIITTQFNNSYCTAVAGNGTSYACPIAASGAALVLAKFKNKFSPAQAAEQLRVTADYIDNIGANVNVANKIGKGRINLYRALTDTATPSIRIQKPLFTDNNDGIISVDDTILFSGKFLNYLAASGVNLKANVSAVTPGVSVIQNLNNLGIISTMQSRDSRTNPFKIVLDKSIVAGSTIMLRIDYSDLNYIDYEFVEYTIPLDFVNFSANNISTTITSKGNLAYNNLQKTQGAGFTSIVSPAITAKQMGFMLAKNSGEVADALVGAQIGTQDRDWKITSNVQFVTNTATYKETQNTFNDDYLGINKMGVTVVQRSYAYSAIPYNNFIMVEYTLFNNTASTIENLNAGFFSDFDLSASGSEFYNLASANAYTKTGFTYEVFGNDTLLAGVQLLTDQSFNVYNFDVANKISGQIYIGDGFSNQEKINALSSLNNSAGGNSPSGKSNVAQLVSAKNISIPAGQSTKVAFAIFACKGAAEMQKINKNAIIAYHSANAISNSAGNESNLKLYPNPSNGNFNLNYKGKENSEANISLFDMQGKLVKTLYQGKIGPTKQEFNFSENTLQEGTYFIYLHSGKDKQVRKLQILRK